MTSYHIFINGYKNFGFSCNPWPCQDSTFSIFFCLIQTYRGQDSLRNKSSVWLDYIGFSTILNQIECSKNMKSFYTDENNIVLNENSVKGKKTMYK